MSLQKYALIVVILIGFLLRFYRLSEFPVHLNHDEVSQLYDAISIAQTGKDIYGNFMPFIFPSVNDFKPPFYTYTTALFYFIAGFNEVTVRLPGAIFGTLLIPVIYLFTLKLLGNWKIGLGAAFFTAISPFEIFFSRKSFENGIGIFLILLGFSCLLSFVKNYETKSNKLLYISSILFGIAIYTYFSHAIIIPLLLVSFILIFNSSFSLKKRFVLPILIFLICSIPILGAIFLNADTSYRSKTVFILQDVNLGRVIDYGVSNNAIVTIFNRSKAIIDFSFTRYMNQFNPVYIFGDGLDLTNQGLIDIGPLLLIQLPFFILGIWFLINSKDLIKQRNFIFFSILLGMIPSGLTFEENSPHRVVIVFTIFNVICAAGLYLFLNKLSFWRKGIQFMVLFILVFSFLLNFIYFIHIYFVNFPNEKSQLIHYPLKDVVQYAWQERDKYDQVIFDPLYGETVPIIGTAAHYYFAFYGNFPPALLQKEYKLGSKDREVLFDKFSIRKITWLEDKNLKNVLIIGNMWSLPIHLIEKEKIIKVFNYYNGMPAFYAIKL